MFYSEAFIYGPFSDVALDPNSSKTVVATHPASRILTNIRAEGLSYELAAHKLLFLMNESRRLKLSGVQLKEGAALLNSG